VREGLPYKNSFLMLYFPNHDWNPGQPAEVLMAPLIDASSEFDFSDLWAKAETITSIRAEKLPPLVSRLR
jgi:hypothetical protein